MFNTINDYSTDISDTRGELGPAIIILAQLFLFVATIISFYDFENENTLASLRPVFFIVSVLLINMCVDVLLILDKVRLNGIGLIVKSFGTIAFALLIGFATHKNDFALSEDYIKAILNAQLAHDVENLITSGGDITGRMMAVAISSFIFSVLHIAGCIMSSNGFFDFFRELMVPILPFMLLMMFATGLVSVPILFAYLVGQFEIWSKGYTIQPINDYEKIFIKFLLSASICIFVGTKKDED